MRIDCLSCGKSNQFLLPLWTSTTFKFNEDGSLSILHVKPLEILEEKITDNKSLREISCKECGSNEVDIVFNEYENQDDDEVSALEGL
ncbi:MAG: hypothetical protein HOF29_01545 [Candidatus Marinimicrobia bacterium]|jgi:hypothetical protein|nr:hypothetical protein [Bacteroidota bacterium]MBT3894734.1 hypothetical protein [Candidatus Neomarinimicrobiota bacterium]MBT5270743.1 hypothetical protein [Candidatus Neomarinimicrobiota bacterium]